MHFAGKREIVKIAKKLRIFFLKHSLILLYLGIDLHGIVEKILRVYLMDFLEIDEWSLDIKTPY